VTTATLVPKLAKTLGLLGSSHAGEVLAAARAAEMIRRQMGVQWDELLLPVAAVREGAGEHHRRDASHPNPADWRALVALCQRHRDKFSAWEARFLDVIATYRHDPSDKQRQILDGIVAKCR
jgi:hypothetical protein